MLNERFIVAILIRLFQETHKKVHMPFEEFQANLMGGSLCITKLTGLPFNREGTGYEILKWFKSSEAYPEQERAVELLSFDMIYNEQRDKLMKKN